MKNLKKKFIIVIILFIIFILGIEMYKSFVILGEDRNSYVVLMEGKAKLNNSNLELNSRKKLKTQDKIETLGEKSFAMIKWGDGSITRLGGNSVLIINEAEIEQNLLNIKISFYLEKGKTWSDVISFIGKDSYFHETFADTTAAVRGTVFEVNLDKDYLYVEKHEVKLTKQNGDKKIVSEKKPFIISKFNFTDLFKFLQKFKDKAWQNLNKKLDKDFYKSLLKQVGNINNFTKEKVEDISKYSKDKQKELYNNLLLNYQKLNFIDTSDIENYKKKLELKQELIKLSDKGDKENLLISTIYDIKDLAKNKNFSELTTNISILSENKNILKSLDIDFSNYIDIDLINKINLPEGLKQEFNKNFNNIKTNLNLNNIDFDNSIVNSLKNSTDKSLKGITNTINKIKNINNE